MRASPSSGAASPSFLVERIEVEADDAEVPRELTKKLAIMLADKLDRGDEALGRPHRARGRQGETAGVRQRTSSWAIASGWKGIVAQQAEVEWWFDARQGTERTAAAPRRV